MTQKLRARRKTWRALVVVFVDFQNTQLPPNAKTIYFIFDMTLLSVKSVLETSKYHF